MTRRSADPTAIKLLDMTRQLTLAEQMYLYRASARMAGVGLDDDKADAVEAIHACMKKLGLDRAPSRDVYRSWFNEQPASRQWPTPNAAAEAFDGKWLQLRATVDGEPMADLRSLAISRVGSPADPDALLRGLRRWSEEDPDPSLVFSRFRVWAEENIHLDPRQYELGGGGLVPAGEPIHLAFSPNTYIERFGSWLGALAQAGVAQNTSFEDYARACKTDRYLPPEEVFAFLREAEAWSQRERRRPLTRASLDAFRVQLLRQNWEERDLVPVPSGGMITERFGGLIEAMREGGIWDEQQIGRRTVRRGAKLKRPDLAAWVALCASTLDVEMQELAKAGYVHWREGVVDELLIPVPSHATILVNFGTGKWGTAMQRAAATVVSRRLLDEITARLALPEEPSHG